MKGVNTEVVIGAACKILSDLTEMQNQKILVSKEHHILTKIIDNNSIGNWVSPKSCDITS